MGDVLIDLGEQHGRLPSDTVTYRGRPRRFRATLAALSAALLVVLTTDVLVCRRIDAAVAIWPLTE